MFRFLSLLSVLFWLVSTLYSQNTIKVKSLHFPGNKKDDSMWNGVYAGRKNNSRRFKPQKSEVNGLQIQFPVGPNYKFGPANSLSSNLTTSSFPVINAS